DAYGVLIWRQVEGALNRFAFVRRCRAVVDLDAMLSKIGVCDCGAQHMRKVPPRVFVLGEDQKPKITPSGSGLRAALTRQSYTCAHVFFDPLDQIKHSGVGQASSVL